MRELYQQGLQWTIEGREKPTIEAICENLIKKGFIVIYHTPSILKNPILYREKRYNKAMSKAIGIISKFVSDQHQLVI